MALQNFVDKVTVVLTSWLNSVDVLLDTVFGTPTTKAQARAALTSDAPMSLGQGGTGATTAAAARTALGSTATGDAVFTAANAAAARSALVAAASGANTDITSIALQGLADLSNAAAGQIKFPATQNASADANTLDDYEEGTWTPSVGGTATYSQQFGRYTKIGRMVLFEVHLQINLIGTGSTFAISGLPFASATDPSFTWYYAVGDYEGLSTAIVALAAFIDQASSVIQLRGQVGAATSSGGTTALLTSGSRVIFGGAYRV